MKIAYLLNSYPAPSHSFIRREIQALERQGRRIHRFAMRSPHADLKEASDLVEYHKTEHVLALGGPALLFSALRQALRQPGAAFRATATALRLGRRSHVGIVKHLIYLVEALHLRRRTAQLGISHIHAHFGTNPATVALLLRRLGGPSYSFTVHGPEEFDAPYALSLADKIAGAAFVAGISSFGRSQLMRQVTPEHWPKIRVVHCGIDPAKYTPVAMPDGPKRFVCIGRFSEQKGQVIALQALKQALKADPELHLEFVGDGPLRDLLTDQVAELGLAEHVTFSGWQDEAGVARALQRAHALLLPSFAEGLPMVIMEAMASGRPALTTYVAGIPELVVNGECGWMVPAGNAGALADAMASISAMSVSSLQEIGKTAETRAVARHAIDDIAQGLNQLFEEVGAANALDSCR